MIARRLLGILAIVVSLPGLGAAQAPLLRTTGCDADTERAALAALEVELLGASEDARGAYEERIAELVCDAGGAIARVHGAGGAIEQRIDAGPGHPRRIALALVELLEASAAPGVAPDAPGPPPAAPTTTVAWIELAGGAWLGGAPLLALGTVQLGTEIVVVPELAIGAAIAGSFGGIDVPAGRIDLRLISGAVSLRLGGSIGILSLRAGPAARAGVAWWQGTARAPGLIGREASAPWIGLGAIATAAVRFGALPVRAILEVEGGGVAVHSRALALGSPGAAVADGWLEVRLGVGAAIE